MHRRTIAFWIGLLLMLNQCTQPEMKENKEEEKAAVSVNAAKPGFVHTVFFWMKEGVTEEQKKGFEKGLEALGKASTIQSYYYGPPAGTPREVVDNSYDYAWIVHFANSADQDAYQDDPVHHEFIEKYEALWERVQVYDTILK